MPHVSEFHATGDHDRHDVLLVAALAAGDLSGTDRDHALDLTRTCATCADLRDDLVAIARATASVPPPVGVRPRDFQLTPADAARLRPAGWRRLVGSLVDVRALGSRPLGIGLATLGLVGLLVSNAPILSVGSGASLPAAGAGSAARPAAENDSGAGATAGGAAAVTVPGASPAGSMAAASDASFGSAVGVTSGSAAPSAPRDLAAEPVPAASRTAAEGSSADGIAKAATTPGPVATGPPAEAPTTESTAIRPLNIVFALAVLLGLGLLVAARFRSRSTV